MSIRLSHARNLGLTATLAWLAACGASGDGGVLGGGGSAGAGAGNTGFGGASAAGAAGFAGSASAGFPGSAGTLGSGGTVGSGGTPTGGAATAGTATGGSATGGSATGGSAAGGAGAGGTATGGSTTGGTSTAGTSAGGTSTGGGGASTGGSGGSTSTGSCSAGCSNAPAGACSAPQVRVTSVPLGVTLNYSTDEVSVLPLAIAAKPGGGSRIAWMTGYSHFGSSANSRVHIADLDCNDQIVGTPFTMPAYDFQDLAADEDGGVVLLTRDAQGSGAQHCGDINNLCFLPNDRPGCYDMYMVRHDCEGNEVWATKLTASNASTPPFAVSNNTYIWWYQHHGRLAYDGTNYAAYFADASNAVNNNSGNTCHASGPKIDIHQADRMQVVGPTGALLSGHDSFGGGCSHSWTTRIVWDPRTSHFVMVCATDNNCRIAQPPFPLRTIASGTCDGTLFGGDVVNAGGTGYWTAWSQGGTIRLEHFTTGASDKTVANAGSSQHPHLASYGADHMLLTWRASSTTTAAQVYDSTTGDKVGAQFTINVPDHPWQAWKAFPDGSVAYAAAGSASSTIQIARVMPCPNN